MASNWIFLSRPLKNGMPCYDGRENIRIAQSTSGGVTSAGLNYGNHVGTHFDFNH